MGDGVCASPQILSCTVAKFGAPLSSPEQQVAMQVDHRPVPIKGLFSQGF
jgi:hypothetical protein